MMNHRSSGDSLHLMNHWTSIAGKSWSGIAGNWWLIVGPGSTSWTGKVGNSKGLVGIGDDGLGSEGSCRLEVVVGEQLRVSLREGGGQTGAEQTEGNLTEEIF